MADPAPSSAAAKPPAPAPAKPIATEPAPAKVQESGDQDMVEVKQLKPYLGVEDKRVMDGKPYAVARARAAELRASGLVEYVNQADQDRERDAAVKAAGDKVRKKYEVKK